MNIYLLTTYLINLLVFKFKYLVFLVKNLKNDKKKKTRLQYLYILQLIYF